MVPDADRRNTLWTSRVWPDACWSRRDRRDLAAAGAVLTVQPWWRLTAAERETVVAEAQTLPLPADRAHRRALGE